MAKPHLCPHIVEKDNRKEKEMLNSSQNKNGTFLTNNMGKLNPKMVKTKLMQPP